MANGKFLHQHPEFHPIIEALATDLGIAAIVVEKDYGVMHSIYCLQRAGYRSRGSRRRRPGGDRDCPCKLRPVVGPPTGAAAAPAPVTTPPSTSPCLWPAHR